jgi:hypothetical protein
MNFIANQKVTRQELTQVLCTQEIESGLIPDGMMMAASIIEGRFSAKTKSALRIVWEDDLCKEGVIVAVANLL